MVVSLVAPVEAKPQMEDGRTRAIIPASAGVFRHDVEITLADNGWAQYSQAPKTPPSGERPENHFRSLAGRGSEDGLQWWAADRALAEIAAANRNGSIDSPKDRARIERATAIVRDSLLEAAQAAADAARRARTLAETLDEVLAVLADPQRGQMVPVPAIAAASSGEASHLSQREREVLARVAAGRSNKAIAEELYVSPNTVKTHVASLLRKLDVHTRAQLATIAVQQGMR
jgi:DNA-binding CsgD family transcriptional regulator